MTIIFTLFSLIPFYLMGSFPTGLLIAKKYGKDITSEGSGNVGATNVARILGRQAGAITLLVDVCKGVFSTGLSYLLTNNFDYVALAAFSTVLGHCFSLPPILKGGKGVATSLGVMLILSPLSSLIAIVIFTFTYLLTNIVSMSSVTAALLTALSALFLEDHTATFYSLAGIALIIVFRHRSNLMRIIEGQEERLNL